MIRISNSRENEGRCNACCLREELASEERSVCVSECASVGGGWMCVWIDSKCGFLEKKKNNSLKLAVSEVLLCVDTIIFPL